MHDEEDLQFAASRTQTELQNDKKKVAEYSKKKGRNWS